MLLPLFAYGTLRDPEYQQELFARTYHMRRARISGFVARVTSSGYLAATPRLGSIIDGALVDLDEDGYAIADAWEDRAIYDRIETEAVCRDGQAKRCFIYVGSAASGIAVADGRFADRTRAAVISDIRRFRVARSSRNGK